MTLGEPEIQLAIPIIAGDQPVAIDQDLDGIAVAGLEPVADFTEQAPIGIVVGVPVRHIVQSRAVADD